MELKDGYSRYGWVSIILHWLVAILVFTMFALGLQAAQFQPNTEEKSSLLFLHTSFGWILLIPYLIRVSWRFLLGRPRRPRQHPVLDVLGDWIPRMMLILIAIQLTSGIAAVFFYEVGIYIFGYEIIPSPFDKNLELRSVAGTIHIYSAYTLLTMIVLHLGGAIKHLLIDRDNILQSMLWPQDRLPNKNPSKYW